eukprot:1189415-Prorocentrum_minimum.AAC.8
MGVQNYSTLPISSNTILDSFTLARGVGYIVLLTRRRDDYCISAMSLQKSLLSTPLLKARLRINKIYCSTSPFYRRAHDVAGVCLLSAAPDGHVRDDHLELAGVDAAHLVTKSNAHSQQCFATICLNTGKLRHRTASQAHLRHVLLVDELEALAHRLGQPVPRVDRAAARVHAPPEPQILRGFALVPVEGGGHQHQPAHLHHALPPREPAQARPGADQHLQQVRHHHLPGESTNKARGSQEGVRRGPGGGPRRRSGGRRNCRVARGFGFEFCSVQGRMCEIYYLRLSPTSIYTFPFGS